MLLILTILGFILLLVLLIVWAKIDTFLSFIIVSIVIGLTCGLDTPTLSKSLQTGLGKTLGGLVMILGFGAMLGKLVADSGAAQQITQSMIRLFGVNNIRWAMAFAGLLVGIPMFYTAGFVVVIPLIFAAGITSRLPLLYIGIPMIAALSVSHGFLPPHPSPTAIASLLNADIGKTLLYGLIVAIPAIVLAGPVFSGTLKKIQVDPSNNMLNIQLRPAIELPSLGISLLAGLMPLIVLAVTTVAKPYLPADSVIAKINGFIGEPNIAMLLSLLAAVYLLGIRRGQSMQKVMKSLEESIKNIAPVLLIIAGSGVFMQMMTDVGINDKIGNMLQTVPISPLILGWMIAAIIRVCIGSATVAGITTIGILHSQVIASGTSPELMVLSIGAGSLMFSHVNDGGFWLFKEYFNLSIKQTFKTWTVMETIVSVVGLLGVLILDLFV
ncbi:Gnt-I system high-affinity gluconate transporter [Chitinophaga skermanii]|uniref:Gnt-I system high-affinity gluconate transporter n=1 Tax=Chitinophaga skermanii TaxID=331697 RepID=A0A327QI79_9BACT|nr:gluconate:H+ symporter [Chitinophaga skermanii]RAJ04316.1 Gnt-I system high-affinity gluconate transporter [Chitinophaga skermanii]